MEETASNGGFDWNSALDTLGKTYLGAETAKANVEAVKLRNTNPYIFPDGAQMLRSPVVPGASNTLLIVGGAVALLAVFLLMKKA